MATIFDFVTVASFLVMCVAFFMLTEREPRTLMHLLLAGIAFAVANQIGNAGYTLFGSILLFAGVAYAGLMIRLG
jgi:hypothetical protein